MPAKQASKKIKGSDCRFLFYFLYLKNLTAIFEILPLTE